MSKGKHKRNRGNGKRRNRDAQQNRFLAAKMIRDFLVHLAWELRLAAFSLSANRGTVHTELQEQVDGFRQTYGVRRLVALPTGQEPDGARSLERSRCSEALRHLEALDAQFESGLQQLRLARPSGGSSYDTDLIVDFLNSMEAMLLEQNPDCVPATERPARTEQRSLNDAGDDLAASSGAANQAPSAVVHLWALTAVLNEALNLADSTSELDTAPESDSTLHVEPTETARARTAIAIFLADLARKHEFQGQSPDTTGMFVEMMTAYIDGCAGMPLRDFPFLIDEEDIEDCGRAVFGKTCDGSESLTRDQVYHALHWFLASIADADLHSSSQERLRMLVVVALQLAQSGGMSQQQAEHVLEVVEDGIENGFGGMLMREGFEEDDSVQAAYDAVIAFARLLFGENGYVAEGDEFLTGTPFA